MSSRYLLEDNNSVLSFHSADDHLEDDDTSIPEDNFVKYENTYRMESKNPFNEYKVTELMKSEIEKHFNENTKYDPSEAVNVCAALSFSIRENICKMDFDRYKIVCIVEIVEKKNQGFLSAIQFLRDINRDKFVENKFENNNFCASVVVASLYYE